MSATVSRSLARRGQVVILRRPPGTDVTCQGRLSGATVVEVPGQQSQIRRQLHIADTEIAIAGWPGPPRKGDRVLANGATSTVDFCDTRRKGEAIAMHVLTITGAI